MKKIPCLFARDFTDRRRPKLLRAVTPGCEWVLEGEGVATLKRDGSACAVIGGRLFKRYDAKKGKAPPVDAIPCGEPDSVTGHHPHWVPVGDEPESKWHREAWSRGPFVDDTYEIVGPKVNGGAEPFERHTLIAHGSEPFENYARDFDTLAAILERSVVEGIVWHHPDGRMAKLRRDDFGFAWPVKR